MRGMLVDEYGVSAKNSQWYVASMHHWDDHDPGATVEPRDGSVIRLIENSGKNTSERACRALFDGQVDALGVTESQLPTLLANDSVQRLFGNSRDVEAAYFHKTQNLTDHARAGVAKKYRRPLSRIAGEAISALHRRKALGAALAAGNSSLVEAWPNHYLTEEQRIFSTDPWAYGLEANRHVLDTFLSYCHAQGITREKHRAGGYFSSRHGEARRVT